MRCPECEHPETRVVDSRATADSIRRRRECASCLMRFTTYERVERRLPWVRKKDGRRELFDRDKILKGIALACRKRPVDSAMVEAAVRRVEARVDGEAEVTSQRVGEEVMRVLRDVDEVAWLRFMSVYQEFETVECFLQAIRGER